MVSLGNHIKQGRSEGTSNVAFKVLIIASSNVNEVIKTILSQCILLRKDFARTKTLTSKNQLTKQK